MNYTVYILESLADPARHYTGFTEDLPKRLLFHNAGGVPASAPFRPWRVKTHVVFTDREKALNFERYLKSHSGRAFAMKRL
jgi:predicted GIY-YIG superfamily endonuclease